MALASVGGRKIYDVPVSIMADLPVKLRGVPATMASPKGISHRSVDGLTAVYVMLPSNFVVSTPPNVTSPSRAPSLFLCRLTPITFDGRSFACAIASIAVDGPVTVEFDRPSPRMPSMG